MEKYFAGNYDLKESAIPLSFREEQDIEVWEGTLLGTPYLFLAERRELSLSLLSEYQDRFERASGLKPVFLLIGNVRHVARQLMESKIAFITPAGFIFIPGSLLYGPLPSPIRKEPLLWHDSYIPVAQYFLLNPSAKVNSLTLRSQIPFYSRSLLIKALALLEQLRFLKKEGAVRKSAYSLANSLGDSYALIKDRLINPIVGSYYVEKSQASVLPNEVYSSESALSHYTDLVPQCEAYLLSRKDYRENRSLFVGADERKFKEEYLRFDILAYTPLLERSESSFFLNPLDVIAIYQDDKDPRIEEEIDRLKGAYR